MWVLALYGESGAEANEPAALDTDFDGVAECDHVLPSLSVGTGELGCVVTENTFQTFTTSDISLNGASTLDITLEFWNFTSSDEGGYIDNIVVSGTSDGGDPDCATWFKGNLDEFMFWNQILFTIKILFCDQLFFESNGGSRFLARRYTSSG